MTMADLKSRSVRDLASIAKQRKVPGWHAMRKDELVKALLRHSRVDVEASRARARSKATSTRPRPQATQRLENIRAKLAEAKNLTFHSLHDEEVKDRLVVMVRDPYWLHAYWELSRKSVDRAKAALGQYWHGAKPVLRIYEVLRDAAPGATRRPVRDVDIHGGVNNWYIDVYNPPKSYQIDIGYVAPGGRLFCLARSNVVSTPVASSGGAFDRNWADVAKDFDRIFALSGGYAGDAAAGDLKDVLEERLQRPIGDSQAAQFGMGAGGSSLAAADFEFQVDTELIVHGTAHPDAQVTLRGEPVKLRSDGSFAICLNLPDRRHVLPMVASSRDGAEQRTIVLAVDRNTKVMEPITQDLME